MASRSDSHSFPIAMSPAYSPRGAGSDTVRVASAAVVSVAPVAALRGVPQDTIEAARIDGASELQIFFEIMVPQVMSTILVVWTTITITVLKVFDVVMAMTGGQWDTSVLANLMYDWMFRGGGDYGRSSTLAMVLMFAVIPVMAFNIRRFRTEEAQR